MTNYSKTLTETLAVSDNRRVVMKDNFGRFNILVGELSDLVGAANDEGISKHKILALFNNGTNISAVYHK